MFTAPLFAAYEFMQIIMKSQAHKKHTVLIRFIFAGASELIRTGRITYYL